MCFHWTCSRCACQRTSTQCIHILKLSVRELKGLLKVGSHCLLVFTCNLIFKTWSRISRIADLPWMEIEPMCRASARVSIKQTNLEHGGASWPSLHGDKVDWPQQKCVLHLQNRNSSMKSPKVTCHKKQPSRTRGVLATSSLMRIKVL